MASEAQLGLSRRLVPLAGSSSSEAEEEELLESWLKASCTKSLPLERASATELATPLACGLPFAPAPCGPPPAPVARVAAATVGRVRP